MFFVKFNTIHIINDSIFLQIIVPSLSTPIPFLTHEPWDIAIFSFSRQSLQCHKMAFGKISHPRYGFMRRLPGHSYSWGTGPHPRCFVPLGFGCAWTRFGMIANSLQEMIILSRMSCIPLFWYDSITTRRSFSSLFQPQFQNVPFTAGFKKTLLKRNHL